MASLEISEVDSIASLSNAFQRLITLPEIFLMPNLNPAGSNLNHSPLACLCVEKEESSLPPLLQVPSWIPWLPEVRHLLIKMRAQQGLAEPEKERVHGGTLGFRSLGSFSEEARRTLGPRLNPALAPHFLQLVSFPFHLLVTHFHLQ